MKMIMTVVPKYSGNAVLEALVNAGYSATFNETKGGMLRQSQITIFIAVKEESVPEVLEIIKAHCKAHMHVQRTSSAPTDSDSAGKGYSLGGAVTFIWKLDQIEKC